MKSLVWTVVFSMLSGIAMCEDRASEKVVKVTGVSEVKVVPDRALIEIGVEKQSPSASAAKQMEDAAARRILASLRAQGIGEKDIQTTWLSLEPRSYYRKHVRISYFVATQALTATIRDLSKLDAVLESLVRAGGNRIDSVIYETSDLRKLRDQARELAVKAAREKAQALARALGQEIGRANLIEEVAPQAEYSSAISNVLYDVSPSRKPVGPSLAPGEKSVSASVIVAFELQ
ncbi:MAG TPA: SIMPL domain-containing protein [Candidatus Angelobacter sp.]|nr:SIMPL domain-containing protein [Candidatus Angelobacter sp.]